MLQLELNINPNKDQLAAIISLPTNAHSWSKSQMWNSSGQLISGEHSKGQHSQKDLCVCNGQLHPQNDFDRQLDVHRLSPQESAALVWPNSRTDGFRGSSLSQFVTAKLKTWQIPTLWVTYKNKIELHHHLKILLLRWAMFLKIAKAYWHSVITLFTYWA